MTTTALRVALGALPATGQQSLPGRWLFPLSVVAAVAALGTGGPLSPVLATGLGVAILLLGLPHGALDIAHLQRGPFGLSTGVVLYLAIIAATAALWLLDSVLGLAIFLALATWHFAEDWDHLPKPIAIATSAAIISAPALLHLDVVQSLFIVLADDARAAGLAEIALLVAPVLLMTAVAGVLIAWNDGGRAEAVSTAAALTAMVALPPLVGFALVFCLHHSPRQFAQGCRDLGWRIDQAARGSVVFASVGGAALAIACFAIVDRATVADAVTSAVFLTLAVLTVPHMLLPVATRGALARQPFGAKAAGRRVLP